jgi:serine/threonine protein phosphatase PrpC
MVLLATDGLEEDVSGLTLEQAAAILRTGTTAEERARALVERVRSAAAGGGRDNIGLVVLCP